MRGSPEEMVVSDSCSQGSPTATRRGRTASRGTHGVASGAGASLDGDGAGAEEDVVARAGLVDGVDVDGLGASFGGGDCGGVPVVGSGRRVDRADVGADQ